MDRIILLGKAHQFALRDIDLIGKECKFLFEKEHKLANVLYEAIAECSFAVELFCRSRAEILTAGTNELGEYISQMNAVPDRCRNLVFEVHAIELSASLKSFLLLAKYVLDKLVPLYSYRFGGEMDKFSKGGKALVSDIERNKHVEKRKELLELLRRAKSECLDAVIELRDEYAHYSSLPQYSNFTLSGNLISERKITGINDFTPPTIKVASNVKDAQDFMGYASLRMAGLLSAISTASLASSPLATKSRTVQTREESRSLCKTR